MVHPRSKLARVLAAAFAATGVVIACALPAGAQPAPNPSPPPGKALLPETDLKNFPKLPVTTGPAPATTIGGNSAGSVIAVEVAGALTTTSFYDPAPGVSVQQLYSRLKSQGVRGLIDPSNTAAAAAAAPQSATAIACTYATATSFVCPVAGWTNTGYAHPQIHFNDQTSVRWPVPATTSTWNQAANIDSLYGNHTCGSGGHCVPLVDANYGNNGWAGHTPMTWNGNILLSASIQL